MKIRRKRKHKTAKKVVYIHYGCEHFNPDSFGPIKNRRYPDVKPEHTTGLWASPVKSKYGWRDFCENEDFCVDRLNKQFKFVLADNARVCHLDSINDLLKLPQRAISDDYKGYLYGLLCCYYIDFEKTSKMYDAIELHLTTEPRRRFGTIGLYDLLYGWDCDSILILNPDVVKEIA